MGALEQMCCGGGLFLTMDACKRIDESIQRGIENAVQRAVAEMQRLKYSEHEPRERYTYKQFCDEYDVCPATIRNWAKHKIVSIESKGNRRYVHIERPDAYQLQNRKTIF